MEFGTANFLRRLEKLVPPTWPRFSRLASDFLELAAIWKIVGAKSFDAHWPFQPLFQLAATNLPFDFRLPIHRNWWKSLQRLVRPTFSMPVLAKNAGPTNFA